MAVNFPNSPSDGQIFFDTTTGNRYMFDAATSRWKRAANSNPYVDTSDTQVLFNNNGSIDGVSGLTFNSSANTLTANTINAYSMRVTGNLYIGSNTVTITNDAIMAQSFFIMDNGTPVAVPTGTTSNASYSVANAAFTHTNTTLTHSQAVYNAVNSVFGVANAAFGSANNVAPQVEPAYNTANGGYTVANSAYGFANGVATNAAAAFAAANNVAPQVTPAYNTANAAYTLANTKYSSSGGTISGNVSIVGDLNVRGNTYFVDQQTLVIGDPLIYLAGNNYTSDVVDIGFIANYVNTSSINVHTGLFRSAGTKEYYLFQGYDKEPANNYIDPTGNNITRAVLNSDIRTSNLNLGGANAINWISSAFDKANAANVLAYNTGIGANNYAGVMANSANAVAATKFANTSGAVFSGTLNVASIIEMGNPPVQYNASTGAAVLLELQSSSTTNAAITVQSGLSRYWISTPYNTNVLHIGGNGGSIPSNGAITIDSGYNVGVKCYPSYPLDVNGNMRIRYDSSTGAGTWFNTQTLSSVFFLGTEPSGNTFRLWDSTAGTNRLLLDSSGNFGVGATPACRLHVGSSTQPSDADGLIKAESTSAANAVNASLTTKNWSGTSQMMQWENYGLRFGSRIITNYGAGNIYFTVGNDSVAATLDTNNHFVVNGSARAPIFYDLDNTAFYVNPNSTSAVSGAILIGPNSYSEYTRIGGVGPATDYATLAASNGNLHIDSKNGYGLYLNYGSSGTINMCQGGGYTYSAGSMRSPVFYDSDDTGYYVNPNSGFNLIAASGITFYGGSSGVYVANPEGNGQTLRLGAAWGKTGIYCGNDIIVGAETRIGFWVAGAERAYVDSSYRFAFNSGFGSTALAYGCRAWVNTRQDGGILVRGSGGVSSTTDSGSLTVTVNFSTTMPDTGFSTTAYARDSNDDAIGCWVGGIGSEAVATTYKRVRTTYGSGEVSLAFHR